MPIETLIPGENPIELVAYHIELARHYPNWAMETKYLFVKNVRPNWVIFDVGAGVGCFSVLFSRLAIEGHIYAFEPTATVEMLRANLARNGCSNVQVEHVALGSKTGAIEDSISQVWGHKPERQVYPFYRLDDYVRNNNIAKLDCILIDVDSFAFEVLLGARETLHTLKPIIVVKLSHALSLRNQSNLKALEWLGEQGVEEVLSLDGCTFVITPGRRPSSTYSVQQTISIAIADARELPPPNDASTIKVTRSIDPHHAAIVHGDAQLTVLLGGSAIEVVTAEPQWAYSVAFAMPSELEPDPSLRILIDLEVLNGRIGVGCLGRDGQYSGPERQISPGGRRAVLLPVSDPANLVEVMLRNGSAQGQRSTVRIHGLKIGHLIEAPTAETQVSVKELARRVQAAVNSDGHNDGFEQPLSDDVVEVVNYEQLGATLGFRETFIQPAGSGDRPLAFWRMERDDAPIFRFVYRNFNPRRHLEFGTWEGFGVVACAESCAAEIWTLNLPEGEKTCEGHALYARPGEDGGLVQTDAGESIGHLYREAGYSDRVHQILCDSTQWSHEGIGPGFFDTVLIDGGHTPATVAADTDKAIPLVRSGGIVMWHDFCPDEEALSAHVAPRGVVEAIVRNHPRWRESFSKLFWARPSWVLIGVRR